MLLRKENASFFLKDQSVFSRVKRLFSKICDWLLETAWFSAEKGSSVSSVHLNFYKGH